MMESKQSGFKTMSQAQQNSFHLRISDISIESHDAKSFRPTSTLAVDFRTLEGCVERLHLCFVNRQCPALTSL